MSATACGFFSSSTGLWSLPPVGMDTTRPPASYEGWTYAMSWSPSTFIGIIDSSAGDLVRHFSLPVARSIATISLAPVVASVGR